jgi:DNA (cytosine-5)-methyltransferase 1
MNKQTLGGLNFRREPIWNSYRQRTASLVQASLKQDCALQSVSLFSGAAGLDIGLEASGFVTRCCADLDPVSCKTLEKNQSIGRNGFHRFLKNASILNVDLNKVNGLRLLRSAGLRKNDVGLISGGPPCQAFSVFGLRKGASDPRGQLVFRFAQLVREITPTAFLLENVPGMGSLKHGHLLKRLIARLSRPRHSLSYNVQSYELEAADFGVPQFRRRLFIIGNRLGIDIEPPKQTHGHNSANGISHWITVGTAFDGLPSPLASALPNHRVRKHSARMISRFNRLEWGERDIPTRTNKLHPNKPAFTIVVGSDKGGGKGHIHPYEPREITPREAARLQTFPDYWIFEGTTRDVIRQIGNAVPPLLATKVGSQMLHDLYGYPIPDHSSSISILGQRHLTQTNVLP